MLFLSLFLVLYMLHRLLLITALRLQRVSSIDDVGISVNSLFFYTAHLCLLHPRDGVEEPNPKRQAGSTSANAVLQEEKLKPLGLEPKPVGTFPGGTGKEKQNDFILIVHSLSREGDPLASKGLDLHVQ